MDWRDSAIALLVLVACEPAPPSNQPVPTPEPTPIPTPVPAPKPIKHTLEHDSDDVMIAASPTAIFVDGITVLELSPKTPKDDIRTAVEVVLKSSKKSRDRRVFINADKSLAYAQIIEILEAANHAGFKDIVFGVAPHD